MRFLRTVVLSVPDCENSMAFPSVVVNGFVSMTWFEPWTQRPNPPHPEITSLLTATPDVAPPTRRTPTPVILDV